MKMPFTPIEGGTSLSNKGAKHRGSCEFEVLLWFSRVAKISVEHHLARPSFDKQVLLISSLPASQLGPNLHIVKSQATAASTL